MGQEKDVKIDEFIEIGPIPTSVLQGNAVI